MFKTTKRFFCSTFAALTLNVTIIEHRMCFSLSVIRLYRTFTALLSDHCFKQLARISLLIKLKLNRSTAS